MRKTCYNRIWFYKTGRHTVSENTVGSQFVPMLLLMIQMSSDCCVIFPKAARADPTYLQVHLDLSRARKMRICRRTALRLRIGGDSEIGEQACGEGSEAAGGKGSGARSLLPRQNPFWGQFSVGQPTSFKASVEFFQVFKKLN